MLVPNRHGSSESYRYGFNGMEKDDELKGEGNSYDFGDRNIYDSRVSRFFSTDPDDGLYPSLSPYLFGANNPIFYIDQDGRGPIIPKEWWKGNPGNAFFAGMVDEAWDSGQSFIEIIQEAFWFSENPDEWEARYGQQRREQYKAVVTIFNDEDARAKLASELFEQTGIYIQKLTGANGEDVAQYEKGKLAFKGLTEVIGLGGLNSFLKTGKFTDDALKLIKKSKEFKPCGCFTKGTQVYTENGYKNIEDVKLGDKVWAFDEKTGELQLKEVTDTFSREFKQIYKIYFGNEIIEATHEHPFFIGGKWLKVDELNEGDNLTRYDGTIIPIKKIVLIEGEFNVYNFTVDEFHTYFVSKQNVLVHNGNPCSFGNIYEFFEKSKIGKILKDQSTRTGKRYGKSQIMKVDNDVEGIGLKKGDYYYLDDFHNGTELEVFDSKGKFKKTVNSDTGEIIESKTNKGLEEKRTIDIK